MVFSLNTHTVTICLPKILSFDMHWMLKCSKCKHSAALLLLCISYLWMLESILLTVFPYLVPFGPPLVPLAPLLSLSAPWFHLWSRPFIRGTHASSCLHYSTWNCCVDLARYSTPAVDRTRVHLNCLWFRQLDSIVFQFYSSLSHSGRLRFIAVKRNDFFCQRHAE